MSVRTHLLAAGAFTVGMSAYVVSGGSWQTSPLCSRLIRRAQLKLQKVRIGHRCLVMQLCYSPVV
jgi:hypothetical protein